MSPNYPGLRTADALIRFHGRLALGLTVAISQHAYNGDIDAERTRSAWQAWLTDAPTTASA